MKHVQNVQKELYAKQQLMEADVNLQPKCGALMSLPGIVLHLQAYSYIPFFVISYLYICYNVIALLCHYGS